MFFRMASTPKYISFFARWGKARFLGKGPSPVKVSLNFYTRHSGGLLFGLSGQGLEQLVRDAQSVLLDHGLSRCGKGSQVGEVDLHALFLQIGDQVVGLGADGLALPLAGGGSRGAL